MVLPSDPAVFNRNKDAIRTKIEIEIKRWRVLSGGHTLKMDDMRRRHADAVLERLFWFDRYLGNFDPYDVARWAQHDFPITVLLAMAELLYGAESKKVSPSVPPLPDQTGWTDEEAAFWGGLKVNNPPPDGTLVNNLDIHCGDADDNCEGGLRWFQARIYCGWHAARRKGLVSGENTPLEGTTA